MNPLEKLRLTQGYTSGKQPISSRSNEQFVEHHRYNQTNEYSAKEAMNNKFAEKFFK